MPDKIRLDALSYSHGTTRLLDRIDLAVGPGELVMITGASGCGKTHLLEMCAVLLKPHSGKIFWDGIDMWDLPPNSRLAHHRRIGFVFQKNALISNLTVFDNIALPLRYHSEISRFEIRDSVEAILHRFDLSSIAAKRPEELSAVQGRWVAIARAMIMKPEILFLDEPTDGMDSVNAQRILCLITELRNRQATTIIMVGHSVRVALQLGCPVLMLSDGKLSKLRHMGK